VHAHAIGDAAIDQALDAFAAALGTSTGDGGSPPDARGLEGTSVPRRTGGRAAGSAVHDPPGKLLNPLRHRIEHCELAHDDQLARMARLGIVASSQPNFVGEWSGKGGMYEARIGEVFRLNNRFRTMILHEVPLAFGSDGMPFGPLVGLQAAVDHPIPSERLAPLEAAWHYTWMAAWSLHWEDAVGSLAPGKRADLVIIDGDPEGQPKAWIVRKTIIDGRVVHTAKE
jgi:predicted amidohydrolase YtcJ